MEAPWKEMSDEESSDEEVDVGSSLYPGELASKRTRDEASSNRRAGAGGREGLEGRGKAIASEACQGSVQILVVQCWLLAGT